MGVTVYRYSDASAPTLQGIVGGALTAGAFADGSLVELLRKCLVAGYGSKSGAGWTMPYTATSKAVFCQGGGSLFYLDVDDSAPATAKEARVRGYETMSAVATGTGPFPTTTQVAATNWRKSNTADTVQRNWILVADERTFYLFVQNADVAGVYDVFAFGDTTSVFTGDAYKCMIIARNAENAVSSSSNSRGDEVGTGSAPGTALLGHYYARAYTGLGGPAQFGKSAVGGSFNSGANPNASLGLITAPQTADGTIPLAKCWTYNGATVRRGYLRGAWMPLHQAGLVSDLDTISGLAGSTLAGKTFLYLKGTLVSTNGIWCFDITGPWDTTA